MSTQRIDARDVLDANARTAVNFRARICGHFGRTGPNTWDDYVFQPVENGEIVDVLTDVPIQVESEGAEFRMRRHGEVERLIWHRPTAKPPGRTPVPVSSPSASGRSARIRASAPPQ